jgi:hypothetical protein
MLRSLSLHPLSLVLGIVFSGICFGSMSQVGVTKESWGPPKRDIVNAYSSPAGISIPAGGLFTVYTVPNDRWPTLTGASGNTSSYPRALWSEVFNSSSTVKGFAEVNDLLFSPESCGGAIGWTFRPGSNVVLQNSDPGSTTNVHDYALIGYLSRE